MSARRRPEIDWHGEWVQEQVEDSEGPILADEPGFPYLRWDASRPGKRRVFLVQTCNPHDEERGLMEGQALVAFTTGRQAEAYVLHQRGRGLRLGIVELNLEDGSEDEP